MVYAWARARLCKLQKGCTRLAASRDKVYQLLADGWWFSLSVLIRFKDSNYPFVILTCDSGTRKAIFRSVTVYNKCLLCLFVLVHLAIVLSFIYTSDYPLLAPSNSLPLERKYIKSDTCIMLLFNSKYNFTVISKPHTQTFYISCMLHNFMREKNIKLNF
jgi:hypothetical protein